MLILGQGRTGQDRKGRRGEAHRVHYFKLQAGTSLFHGITWVRNKVTKEAVCVCIYIKKEGRGETSTVCLYTSLKVKVIAEFFTSSGAWEHLIVTYRGWESLDYSKRGHPHHLRRHHPHWFHSIRTRYPPFPGWWRSSILLPPPRTHLSSYLNSSYRISHSCTQRVSRVVQGMLRSRIGLREIPPAVESVMLVNRRIA